MKNAKLYINHKLYDISRGLLDWAVRKQYWKLAGTISGWRNRLVIPILQDLHDRLIITAPPIVTTTEEPKPAKTKTSKTKKIQRKNRSVR
jgi:hypothetical protein